MYDDEFELTFDLSDEDKASRAPEPEQEPVQEAAPEPATETEPPVEPVPEPAVPAANGRCVLISGGDRGIGAAAARAFYAAGYRVAVFYHTNAEAAAALQKELPGVLAVQCDVASRASCELAFRAAEQALGRVDVLVSNAGIAQQKLFTDLTEGSYYVMRGEPNAENAKKYNFTVQDTARQQNWNVPVFTLRSAIALAVLAVIAAGVIWLLVFLWGVLARRKARKAAEAQKEEKNEEDSNKKES